MKTQCGSCGRSCDCLELTDEENAEYDRAIALVRDEQESDSSGEFSEDGETESEARAFLSSGKFLGLVFGVEV